MKRSDINGAIRRMEKLIADYRFALPPFLHWTPAEWAVAGHEYDEIRDNMLGWDVTDFGMGRFGELGLTLITLRNGNPKNARYTKTYAEKLLMIEEGQRLPMHFHRHKMEDIINRGGGDLVFRLYTAADDGSLSDAEVAIDSDGRRYTVAAGQPIVLRAGESITLYPKYYHEATIAPGTGTALLGEVSMCNDDNTDNRFLDRFPRFPKIEEDEAPYRLLCNEYPQARD